MLCNNAIFTPIFYRSLPALKVDFMPSVDLLALGVAWAPLFFDFQPSILYMPVCVLCNSILKFLCL